MNETNVRVGLSSQEVQARIARGQDNSRGETASKTIGSIIRTNAVTVFNIFNVCLLALVLVTGGYRNALFFVAVLGNTVVGVYQEIKAKRIIERMSLLGKSPAYVLRDGEEQAINRSKIVIDDICVLKKGSQIPVDAVIVGDNPIEVDESMLTGESDSIIKQKGDKVFGGSIVLLGQTQARVTAVGRDVYVNQLSAEAKSIKIKKSKLQRQINLIIKVMTGVLVVVGPLLFIRQITVVQYRYVMEWQDVLLRSLSAVIGMMPQGLVLMTSVALTAGVITLARHRVLAQELPAIETLARVDVLCLDKTGTLTEGSLKVSETVYYGSNQDHIQKALAALAIADEEQNATAQAIGGAFPDAPDWRATKKIPFSSRTKWQAIEFEGEGAYILGAPDVVLPLSADEARLFCKNGAEKGLRALALLHTPSPVMEDILPDDRETLAVLLMADQVRQNAAEILKYFKNQNVDVRVISGDHPATVAHICENAGLTGQCLDARDLPDDPELLKEMVRDTKIFGRVTPGQKKQIVETLQAEGHVVAMTGDGVNDILAMKQSDCGVAMAAGSEATQSVAQFVLLDSDFAVLPRVVEQGRKVINNMNRVAALFLIKTTWSFLLALSLAILLFPYPFTPLQVQVIDFLVIGMPSFLLTMEPNYEIVKGDFLKKMIVNSLPGAISVSVWIILTLVLSQNALLGYPFTQVESWIITDFIIIVIGVHLGSMFLNCWPPTRFRMLVLGLVLAGSVAFFLLPPIMNMFGVTPPDDVSVTLRTIAAGFVLMLILRVALRRVLKE